MNILVTNDDGIQAEGLSSLVKYLKKAGFRSVTVVAPLYESSAVGHAITMATPLRVEKIYKNNKFFGYGVNGTPADCVKLGVRVLLKKKPDWVLSGINCGENSAVNVIYSGTVSAATEAAILGIRSMAFSLCQGRMSRFSRAAGIAVNLFKKFKSMKLPEDTFLNVNIPARKTPRGMMLTHQGRSRFIEKFDRRTDPRGRDYYWLAGEKMKRDGVLRADDEALRRGFVSVTPLRCDMTSYGFLKKLRESPLGLS